MDVVTKAKTDPAKYIRCDPYARQQWHVHGVRSIQWHACRWHTFRKGVQTYYMELKVKGHKKYLALHAVHMLLQNLLDSLVAY